MGKVRDSKRERAEPGQVVEAHEDEITDPRGQQAGHEDDSEQRTADPVASMRRKAPTMGEPSRVLMAAKLPAPAMTMVAVGGASRFARWTASAPSPPPMATSGPSGPSTTPNARVASAA